VGETQKRVVGDGDPGIRAVEREGLAKLAGGGPGGIGDGAGKGMAAGVGGRGAGAFVEAVRGDEAGGSGVADGHVDARARGEVSGGVARPRRQAVRTVGDRRRVPVNRIGRYRIFSAQRCAVEEELNTRDADVVAGGGAHRDRAGDGGGGGGRRERDRGRRAVHVGHRDRNARGDRAVAGRVAGAGFQGVRAVDDRGRVPRKAVRAQRVLAAEGNVVQQELDARHANIVGRIRAN